MRIGRKNDEQQRLQWRKETVLERQNRVSLEVYDALGGTVRYGPFEGCNSHEPLGGVAAISGRNV